MKTKKIYLLESVSLMILLLLTACGAPSPTPMPTETPTALPVTGIEYHFVINKLLIPTAGDQAASLNVDGDAQGNLDNKFGELISLLTAAVPDVGLQATLDQGINSGQLVSLHMIKADDPVNDPSVLWSIYQGQKTESAPRFDGTDSFMIDSASPVNSALAGTLTNGRLAAGPGNAHIQMFLMGQLFEMDLLAVRIEADINANGCTNGVLAGGISVGQFREKVLPAVAGGLNEINKTDKAFAGILMQAFDFNKDGNISVQELESNPLLMLALSPDLDLMDASGQFNPGQDGVKDSYSIGLGFSCVPATFTAPME